MRIGCKEMNSDDSMEIRLFEICMENVKRDTQSAVENEATMS